MDQSFINTTDLDDSIAKLEESINSNVNFSREHTPSTSENLERVDSLNVNAEGTTSSNQPVGRVFNIEQPNITPMQRANSTENTLKLIRSNVSKRIDFSYKVLNYMDDTWVVNDRNIEFVNHVKKRISTIYDKLIYIQDMIEKTMSAMENYSRLHDGLSEQKTREYVKDINDIQDWIDSIPSNTRINKYLGECENKLKSTIFDNQAEILELTYVTKLIANHALAIINSHHIKNAVYEPKFNYSYYRNTFVNIIKICEQLENIRLNPREIDNYNEVDLNRKEQLLFDMKIRGEELSGIVNKYSNIVKELDNRIKITQDINGVRNYQINKYKDLPENREPISKKHKPTIKFNKKRQYFK